MEWSKRFLVEMLKVFYTEQEIEDFLENLDRIAEQRGDNKIYLYFFSIYAFRYFSIVLEKLQINPVTNAIRFVTRKVWFWVYDLYDRLMRWIILNEDAPYNYQTYFQDAATPVMRMVINLYEYITTISIIIFFFVFFLLINSYREYNYNRYYENVWKEMNYDVVGPYYRKIYLGYEPPCPNGFDSVSDYLFHNRTRMRYSVVLETVWTFLPTILVVLIALPGFVVLYSTDEVPFGQDMPHDAPITLKAIGRQWYWRHEVEHTWVWLTTSFHAIRQLVISRREIRDTILVRTPEGKQLDFRYYVKTHAELMGERLAFPNLDTDRFLILPARTPIRLVVTSSDVIHAWSVPSFGVKIDAIPGRINQTWFYIERTGLYFGQCAELCGEGHGFMPFQVHAIPPFLYDFYIGTVTCVVRGLPRPWPYIRLYDISQRGRFIYAYTPFQTVFGLNWRPIVFYTCGADYLVPTPKLNRADKVIYRDFHMDFSDPKIYYGYTSWHILRSYFIFWNNDFMDWMNHQCIRYGRRFYWANVHHKHGFSLYDF